MSIVVTEYRKIRPDEMKDWLDSGRKILVVDVTLPEVYAQRHIEGAVNVCVYEVGFAGKIAELIEEGGGDVVLYGTGGDALDAETAADKLLRAGLETVYLLSGGVGAWRDAGYPMDGLAPSLPDPVERNIPTREDEGFYGLVPEGSIVHWTGRNANGSHTGTVRLSGGELTLRGGMVTGFAGIDMSTVANDDVQDLSLRQLLVDHLMSDDFFFVSRHPNAQLVITQGMMVDTATPGAQNIMMAGRLDLRGVTGPVTFSGNLARVFTETGDPGGLVLDTHFDIDRTQWGVNYGSGKFFRNLGYHLVYDVISLQTRALFRRK